MNITLVIKVYWSHSMFPCVTFSEKPEINDVIQPGLSRGNESSIAIDFKSHDCRMTRCCLWACLSSVPFCKCERRFSSYQNLVKPYQTSKAPSSCLRAGQIFVKRRNCQILQFTGVKMAVNVNQGNLVSLFRVCRLYTFNVIDNYGYQIFWCFLWSVICMSQ